MPGRLCVLFLVVAGCGGNASVGDGGGTEDALSDTTASADVGPDVTDGSGSACEVAATIGSDPRVSNCAHALGTLSSERRALDITVAADGLYVVTQSGAVEHWLLTSPCRYQPGPVVEGLPQAITWRAAEADASGITYFLGSGTGQVLAWIGAQSGQCAAPTGVQFGLSLATLGAGRVALAYANQNGAAIIDTTTCSIEPLVFAPNVGIGTVGVVEGDVLVGDRNVTAFLGRYRQSGEAVFESSAGYVGQRNVTLHGCTGAGGAGICTLGPTRFYRYSATDGSELEDPTPATLFGDALPAGSLISARMDVSPDDSFAIVVGTAQRSSTCDRWPLIYRIDF